MRPLTFVAVGLVLVAVDIRTEHLDFLPDALGWVLFTKGRLDEAEQELLKALALGPGGRQNLYHLGRFYEAKNDGAMVNMPDDGR